MEIRHDWKSLNEVLFPNETASSLTQTGSPAKTAVLIEDGGKITDSAFSNGAFFDTKSASASELDISMSGSIAARNDVEKMLILSRKDINQFVSDASGLGANYFQQLSGLRSRIVENQKSPLIISRKHFMVDLFSGWFLKKLVPNRFNMLVFIDNRSSLTQAGAGDSNSGYKAILLSYADGKLDQFFEPDFASLHGERLVEWRRNADLIGQYLENRYLLPCYGIFMFRDVWERMIEVAQAPVAAKSSSFSPWRLFVRYFDDSRAAIYPNGLVPKLLLATQRIMVYLGFH